MDDVTIEHLEVTVELDGAGAREHFARLFAEHVGRWWADEQARRAQEHVAEAERRIPGAFR